METNTKNLFCIFNIKYNYGLKFLNIYNIEDSV